MFSINEYRDSEKHHLSSIDSYVFSSMHNLELFQSMGFPVRIEKLRNLSLIIDSMQQNRFERYMKELNGLDQNEFHLIVSALIKFVKLQAINFGDRDCRLPITTFLSAFTLCHKLKALIEGNKSAKIFEIGAGCGYQSYFLAEEDNISLYAQTEAAESYYILQSMVNSSAYGVHFKNEAYLEKAVSNFFYNKSAKMAEDPTFISIPQKIRCIQYPWWAYGKATENAPFDIVTSNANLLEFTPEALDNYLEFSSAILKKDGLLLAQCCGSNAKRSFEYLKDKLIEHNYSVLFFSTFGHTIEASHIPNSEFKLKPHHPTVYNLLLSKNVHENINFRNIELNFQGANYIDADFIARAFFGRSENNVYTKNDFINAVEEQLKKW